jgi:hypothetical protein
LLKILDKPYSRGELANALRGLLDADPVRGDGEVAGDVPSRAIDRAQR